MKTLTTKIRSDSLRPPLKWPGGKRWLVPRLKTLYEGHRHRRLVEPFCGGLSVALALEPARALLSDINPHLINFYRQVGSGLSIKIPMSNSKTAYQENRDRFNELVADHKHGTVEAAALFYYLNRTGYNGLCRFNGSGGYNVPFGRYARINYTTDFSPYRKALAAWDFDCIDFQTLAILPTDFIYADPPYDGGFAQYWKDGFAWHDQVRLAERLAKHPGPVVLSNKKTTRIVELYGALGFSLNDVKGPRSISCNGDRKPNKEILATKNV